MWWLVVVALLPLQPADAAAAATSPGPACPRSCRCSGDVTQLECVGAQLPAMTSAAALAVTSLAVSGLELAALEKRHLWGFANLQSLTLSNGRISEIADDAFRDLLHLRSLNLASNEIYEFPVDALAYNAQLKRLVLSENPLQLPALGPALRCPSLELLDLSGCGIRAVGWDAFSGVPHLRELHMENNFLAESPVEALSQLKELTFFGHGSFVDEDPTFDLGPAVVSHEPLTAPGLTVWQIALICGLTISTMLVAVGAYQVWGCVRRAGWRGREAVSQRNHPTSRSDVVGSPALEPPEYAEIAAGQSFGGRDSYRPLSQRELIPLRGWFPGYVYDGCECPLPPATGRYPFYEDVDFYSPGSSQRRPMDRLPEPPPYPRETVHRQTSRQYSVASSTLDSTTQTDNATVGDVNV